MNNTTLKITLGVVIASAIFAFIPYILIMKMITKEFTHGFTAYFIIFISNFLVFYFLVMITYRSRLKLKKRREDFSR